MRLYLLTFTIMNMDIPDVVIRMTEEAVYLQNEGGGFVLSVEGVYQDVERLKYQIGEIVMAIIVRDYINQ